MSEQITGAQSLVTSLEAAGVTDIFGIPGGAILPAYDPLMDSKIRHILVRHEQGAGHAAQGFAVATGRVGVCMATSGPGAESDEPRLQHRRFVVRVSSRWPKNKSTANTDRSATSAPAVMKKSRFSARIDMRC